MSVALISLRGVTQVVMVRVLPTEAEAAAPAIRVIAKVAEAYTTLRANIEAGNYGPPGSPKR
jgi:hypothetical protein